MLDVFSQNAFGVTTLTDAINKAPYTPNMLGGMGLFQAQPISTLTIDVEEQEGHLQIIPTAARGSMPNVDKGAKRNVRTLKVCHIPLNATILADQVQNVRRFGSESELEGVQQVVNDQLASMRQSFEATHEYHRLGAVKGIILDADGSTLLNLFTAFGISQTTLNLDLSDAEAAIKTFAVDLRRKMGQYLGGTAFQKVQVLCGDTFFDTLVEHPLMRTAWERYNNGQFLREDQSVIGFEYPTGVFWMNYVGYTMTSDNTVTPFLAADEAQAFPAGVPGLFKVAFGPADFAETVNTLGLPYYAKQSPMKWDKGVELHAQSNPVHYCTRPKSLVKITMDAEGS